MAGDWQPGDLALCIKQGPWRFALTLQVNDGVPIRCGGIYRVRAIGHSVIASYPVLWFDEYPGNGIHRAFAHFCFRKVTPPEADEFDREVIDLMAGVPETAEG